MKVYNIKKFLQTAYTDAKLAALLAHAQDGKLEYNSCCCFIGAAQSDHALFSEGEFCYLVVDHLEGIRQTNEFANEAEMEFLFLGNTSDERRERIIPLIVEEMQRRESIKLAFQLSKLQGDSYHSSDSMVDHERLQDQGVK